MIRNTEIPGYLNPKRYYLFLIVYESSPKIVFPKKHTTVDGLGSSGKHFRNTAAYPPPTLRVPDKLDCRRNMGVSGN